MKCDFEILGEGNKMLVIKIKEETENRTIKNNNYTITDHINNDYNNKNHTTKNDKNNSHIVLHESIGAINYKTPLIDNIFLYRDIFKHVNFFSSIFVQNTVIKISKEKKNINNNYSDSGSGNGNGNGSDNSHNGQNYNNQKYNNQKYNSQSYNSQRYNNNMDIFLQHQWIRKLKYGNMNIFDKNFIATNNLVVLNFHVINLIQEICSISVFTLPHKQKLVYDAIANFIKHVSELIIRIYNKTHSKTIVIYQYVYNTLLLYTPKDIQNKLYDVKKDLCISIDEMKRNITTHFNQLNNNKNFKYIKSFFLKKKTKQNKKKNRNKYIFNELYDSHDFFYLNKNIQEQKKKKKKNEIKRIDYIEENLFRVPTYLLEYQLPKRDTFNNNVDSSDKNKTNIVSICANSNYKNDIKSNKNKNPSFNYISVEIKLKSGMIDYENMIDKYSVQEVIKFNKRKRKELTLYIPHIFYNLFFWDIFINLNYIFLSNSNNINIYINNKNHTNTFFYSFFFFNKFFFYNPFLLSICKNNNLKKHFNNLKEIKKKNETIDGLNDTLCTSSVRSVKRSIDKSNRTNMGTVARRYGNSNSDSNGNNYSSRNSDNSENSYSSGSSEGSDPPASTTSYHYNYDYIHNCIKHNLLLFKCLFLKKLQTNISRNSSKSHSIIKYLHKTENTDFFKYSNYANINFYIYLTFFYLPYIDIVLDTEYKFNDILYLLKKKDYKNVNNILERTYNEYKKKAYSNLLNCVNNIFNLCEERLYFLLSFYFNEKKNVKYKTSNKKYDWFYSPLARDKTEKNCDKKNKTKDKYIPDNIYPFFSQINIWDKIKQTCNFNLNKKDNIKLIKKHVVKLKKYSCTQFYNIIYKHLFSKLIVNYFAKVGNTTWNTLLFFEPSNWELLKIKLRNRVKNNMYKFINYYTYMMYKTQNKILHIYDNTIKTNYYFNLFITNNIHLTVESYFKLLQYYTKILYKQIKTWYIKKKYNEKINKNIITWYNIIYLHYLKNKDYIFSYKRCKQQYNILCKKLKQFFQYKQYYYYYYCGYNSTYACNCPYDLNQLNKINCTSTNEDITIKELIKNELFYNKNKSLPMEICKYNNYNNKNLIFLLTSIIQKEKNLFYKLLFFQCFSSGQIQLVYCIMNLINVFKKMLFLKKKKNKYKSEEINNCFSNFKYYKDSLDDIFFLNSDCYINKNKHLKNFIDTKKVKRIVKHIFGNKKLKNIAKQKKKKKIKYNAFIYIKNMHFLLGNELIIDAMNILHKLTKNPYHVAYIKRNLKKNTRKFYFTLYKTSDSFKQKYATADGVKNNSATADPSKKSILIHKPNVKRNHKKQKVRNHILSNKNLISTEHFHYLTNAVLTNRISIKQQILKTNTNLYKKALIIYKAMIFFVCRYLISKTFCDNSTIFNIFSWKDNTYHNLQINNLLKKNRFKFLTINKDKVSKTEQILNEEKMIALKSNTIKIPTQISTNKHINTEDLHNDDIILYSKKSNKKYIPKNKLLTYTYPFYKLNLNKKKIKCLKISHNEFKNLMIQNYIPEKNTKLFYRISLIDLSIKSFNKIDFWKEQMRNIIHVYRDCCVSYI
ncbi:conserved protein, unknown function [Hepatocystis sp. ex Piliocolobus tephrosceles]|nr:conserved protein, unknown function [Hepatocystis sp. ex Piliocolobus tephrosceles]